VIDDGLAVDTALGRAAEGLGALEARNVEVVRRSR
jgi:hypothetical protein